MKQMGLNGKPKVLSKMSQYIIDWDKKCRSRFQYDVKQFLHDFWRGDLVLEEMPVLGCGRILRCDFFNHTRRIMVEANGEQHNSYKPYFHGVGFAGKVAFADQFKRDNLKARWCDVNQVKLVELPYTEWYQCTKVTELLEIFKAQGVELN